MGRRGEQAHRRSADGARAMGGARVDAARSGLCAGHRGTPTQRDRPRGRDAGRAGRRMAHQSPHDPIGAHADRRRARARRRHRPADHRADGRRAGRAGRAAQSRRWTSVGLPRPPSPHASTESAPSRTSIGRSRSSSTSSPCSSRSPARSPSSPARTMRCSGRWIPLAQTLRRRAGATDPSVGSVDLPAVLTFEQGGAGWIARHRQPLFVEDDRDGCAHRGGGVGPEPRPRGLRRGPGGGGRRAPGRAHAEPQAWHAASGGRSDAPVVVRLPGRGGHQQRAALRRGGGAPPRRRDAQGPRARALPGARRRRRRAARGRRRLHAAGRAGVGAVPDRGRVGRPGLPRPLRRHRLPVPAHP